MKIIAGKGATMPQSISICTNEQSMYISTFFTQVYSSFQEDF